MATGEGVYLEDDLSLSSQTFTSAKPNASRIHEAVEIFHIATEIDTAAAPILERCWQEPSSSQRRRKNRGRGRCTKIKLGTIITANGAKNTIECHQAMTSRRAGAETPRTPAGKPSRQHHPLAKSSQLPPDQLTNE